MSLLAVLIDERPDWGATDPHASIAALPAVGGSVQALWERRLAAGRVRIARVVRRVPTGSESGDAFTALREPAVPAVADDPPLTLAPLLAAPLDHFDAFDRVLFVSARLMPSGGAGLAALLGQVDDAERVVHLLAAAPHPSGSHELVCTDPDGRVRRIQRYLDASGRALVASGVIATCVPVRTLLSLERSTPINSLEALRSALVHAGLQSIDVPDNDAVFDLADEASALTFLQHRVRLEGARPGAAAHPGARGAVIIEDGADVAPDALLVGPALICHGARVGSGARIAQSVLLPHVTVDAGATVRHRLLAPRSTHTHRAQRRQGLSPMVPSAPTPVPMVSRYAEAKSWIEAGLAGATLLVLSPLFLVLGLLVKLTSRGPVFYGDPREGLGAEAFRCWKFRTMRPDAHALQRALSAGNLADGPHFKMAHDPRLTPIGSWLRRLNLDELPQLWNVLRREMSFVGPRPSPTRENQVSAPWRQARLSVRPGITGLWQVCRHEREAGDFHQWIEYDMLYVEHCSFAVDLRILVATVLTGGGRRPVPVTSIIPALRRRGEAPSRSGVAPTPVARSVESPPDDAPIDHSGATASTEASTLADGRASRGAPRWRAEVLPE